MAFIQVWGHTPGVEPRRLRTQALVRRSVRRCRWGYRGPGPAAIAPTAAGHGPRDPPAHAQPRHPRPPAPPRPDGPSRPRRGGARRRPAGADPAHLVHGPVEPDRGLPPGGRLEAAGVAAAGTDRPP